jgi:hypothetical protein
MWSLIAQIKDVMVGYAAYMAAGRSVEGEM